MGRLILIVLVASVGTPHGHAQSFKYEKKIQELVQPYLTHEKVNAVSVGVISNGKTWKGHFGTLDGKGTPAPNDQTIYEIGSISKVFTSLLLADAVESGKLKLEDPISSVMPNTSVDLGKITFKQLSHHVSGLPNMPTNIRPPDSTNPFKGYDRKLLTKYMQTARPSRKPDEKYEYSNLGVGLLGDLLSQQAGVGYESLVKQKLTGPLEMSRTGITMSPEQEKRFASPHNSARLADRRWDFDALAGCGALRSNVVDMLKFAEANLNPPAGEVGKVIELAWKQHRPAKPPARAMGLGWMIAGDGTTRWHNGQTGGYQCMLLVSRQLNSATILLCNTAGSGVDALAEQIFQAIVGMNVQPKTFGKEYKVDPKIAQRLAGKYQLAPGIFMTVKVQDGRMTAQLTGQQFLVLNPKSETEWKYQAVDAILKFELPETGNSPKVTLLQNGREMPCRRIGK